MGHGSSEATEIRGRQGMVAKRSFFFIIRKNRGTVLVQWLRRIGPLRSFKRRISLQFMSRPPVLFDPTGGQEKIFSFSHLLAISKFDYQGSGRSLGCA
jgi:hypothetical protein